MAKKLDSVGRVTIPREMRRALRWMDGDLIDMHQEGDTIVLSKQFPDVSTRLLHDYSAFIEWMDDMGATIPEGLSENFYSVIKQIQEQEKINN